ncbi:uncharacterized protein LOC134263220 [Saccostrea cucullata]|uniref:uncharacterized protein LOC134263220 n=1 Tax=Saccostrea cuccullata TaxID=36930 RepID=UPI002ED24B7D
MEREMNRLKDYVVRLEYRVNSQSNQIVDLKARSMENNIIVSGLQEKGPKKEDTKNLAQILRNVFISEMNMGETAVDELQIQKLFRMGEYDAQRKFPRPRRYGTTKQLYEVQRKYAERNIETKMKGDRLIFTQSNSIYREKVGSLPNGR